MKIKAFVLATVLILLRQEAGLAEARARSNRTVVMPQDCEAARAAISDEEKPAFVLTDQSLGCLHNEKAQRAYCRQGDSYVTKQGRLLDKEDLKELVAAVHASKSQWYLDHKELGITPESIEQHKDELLNTLSENAHSKSAPVSCDYLAVSSAVFHRLKADQGSTSHVGFSAAISDPSLSKENILVSSSSPSPWMLPWTVQIGKETWVSYSTEIPRKLSKICGTLGPSAKYLDGSEYWSNGFWKDSDFWSYELEHKFDKSTDVPMARFISQAD